MDKKELLSIIFNLLYKSNLVFTKQSFKKELDEEMKAIKFEIAEGTFNALVKELTQKDYLIQDEKNLIKSTQLLKNDKNKQTDYLSYLISEYSESFDIDYIHDEFFGNIMKNELPSANYVEFIEHSYEVIKEYLVDKKFVKINTVKNQFEL